MMLWQVAPMLVVVARQQKVSEAVMEGCFVSLLREPRLHVRQLLLLHGRD